MSLSRSHPSTLPQCGQQQHGYSAWQTLRTMKLTAHIFTHEYSGNRVRLLPARMVHLNNAAASYKPKRAWATGNRSRHDMYSDWLISTNSCNSCFSSEQFLQTFRAVDAILIITSLAIYVCSPDLICQPTQRCNVRKSHCSLLGASLSLGLHDYWMTSTAHPRYWPDKASMLPQPRLALGLQGVGKGTCRLERREVCLILHKSHGVSHQRPN